MLPVPPRLAIPLRNVQRSKIFMIPPPKQLCCILSSCTIHSSPISQNFGGVEHACAQNPLSTGDRTRFQHYEDVLRRIYATSSWGRSDMPCPTSPYYAHKDISSFQLKQNSINLQSVLRVVVWPDETVWKVNHRIARSTTDAWAKEKMVCRILVF